ncbi:UDP-N-acetylmuramoyl-tripeptide--D-alanyl-D-alanine ligase [Paenibacillus nasutitermitis]|uniref:UDP-N-acetylmuramoyl-tripeptide--D-alanyl-D-alanine ligase n=1 Tax=Paenibacillus nasutitermitis TaxID=1652958 RepID=A0A916YVF3_9BACL|nr:UDP-N-acetylmuramoyl-tripeptide--D-alanyl-D-alanine ligase [Paenibacillus nasutitermitis]GGD63310.1 UDP-N-acetylmuramoyl-tripeptide--D-alanyl-D-alanine ligase [Paenibacillus nasutitermitis]
MIQRSVKQVSVMVRAIEAVAREHEHILIHGVSIDTRTLRQGNLYIPIAGERFNGHDFVEQAIEAGAAAVLWNREEPNPPVGRIPVLLVNDTLSAIQVLAREYRMELPVKVIAITGSNGKTSTKDILASCLSGTFRTQKTFGNLNNHLGVPLTLLALNEDTEVAVVEMGMSGLGEIELLSSLALPDIAIITNIGKAHLGDLGSMENILKAKLEIIHGLKQDGTLYYNGDDPLLSSALRDGQCPVQAITFGMEARNDFHPAAFDMGIEGSSFTIPQYPLTTLTIPLIGQFQLVNALAAIAAASELGVKPAALKSGLAATTLTGMRNEVVHTNRFTLVNDTYKSNPSSAAAALQTLYTFPDNYQKIAVLGDMMDMGDQAVSLHRELGALADGNRLDYLFAYGPLSEHTANCAAERMEAEHVFHYSDKQKMARHIKAILEQDALIWVKASRALKLEEVVAALLEDEELRAG